jgi:hypothetical protein
MTADQMLLPIPTSVRARGTALERLLRSLLRQGFVAEVAVGLADEEWRSGDDGRFGLRIVCWAHGDWGAGVDERARSRARGR